MPGSVSRSSGVTVRVSAAALAKIEVGDRIALAISKAQLRAGRRVFSPFGGAISVLASGRRFLEEDLGAVFEELPRVLDGRDEVDLRLSLPSGRISDFERWFRTGEDRETGPEREVCEELVETGVIHAFAHEIGKAGSQMRTQFLGLAHHQGESRRPGREGVVTERYAEVFAVQVQPDWEELLLRAAVRPADERTVLLLHEEEIRQRIVDGDATIATNCSDLLPESWSAEWRR